MLPRIIVRPFLSCLTFRGEVALSPGEITLFFAAPLASGYDTTSEKGTYTTGRMVPDVPLASFPSSAFLCDPLLFIYITFNIFRSMDCCAYTSSARDRA